MENVDEYFNSGLESDAVIITDSGSYPVKVIYFDEYESAEIMGIEVASSNPEADIRTSELPADIKRSDDITIEGLNNGAPFKFFEKHPNGTGITKLILTYD